MSEMTRRAQDADRRVWACAGTLVANASGFMVMLACLMIAVRDRRDMAGILIAMFSGPLVAGGHPGGAKADAGAGCL